MGGVCAYEKAKFVKGNLGKDNKRWTLSSQLEGRSKEKSASSSTKSVLIYSSQILSSLVAESLNSHSNPNTNFSTPVKHKTNNFMQKMEDFRIVIYGAPESGKSTFGLSITNKKISKYYIPSVYSEIFNSQMFINSNICSFEIVIPASGDCYLNDNANCYFIFFDLSNLKSFEEATIMINELKNTKIPLFLVGNKCDKTRAVLEKGIKKLCKKTKVSYFEISASEGIGIHNLMKSAGEKITRKNSSVKT